jgi:hypothetical protein
MAVQARAPYPLTQPPEGFGDLLSYPKGQQGPFLLGPANSKLSLLVDEVDRGSHQDGAGK